MISKKLFVQTMEDIQKESEFQDKLNSLFEEYTEEGSFCNFRLEYTIVRLLQDIFNDQENDWIGYAIYELDYLKKYKHGMVTMNDENIDISTFEKLYDFLIENMNS